MSGEGREMETGTIRATVAYCLVVPLCLCSCRWSIATLEVHQAPYSSTMPCPEIVYRAVARI